MNHQFRSLKKSLFAVGFTSNSLFSVQAQTRPKIILIITDDQGYGDPGITGYEAGSRRFFPLYVKMNKTSE